MAVSHYSYIFALRSNASRMQDPSFCLSALGILLQHPHLRVDPDINAVQLDPLPRGIIVAPVPEVIRANYQWHSEQQYLVAPVVAL